MALKFKLRESADGSALKVPYVADFDGRSNHGFVDLRGTPDLAPKIAEAAGSRALSELLSLLAKEGSAYFTIGCDLDASEPNPDSAFYQAGGYIQIAFSSLYSDALNFTKHEKLAILLGSRLEEAVGDREWVVDVTIDVIDVESLSGPDQAWCLVIQFAALSASSFLARNSCEELISAFVILFQS
jgi:hypothetical protein